MDALVDAFVDRQPEGLEEAYALWSRDFFGVARHAVADSSLAEDCVHDALVRVWRSPNRFAGDRTMLRAYLMAAVRNEALSVLRTRSRRTAREETFARLTEAPHDDPAAIDPVEAARVRAAIARLPEDQRAALTHAFYGNKTHVEVARDLDAPLGTIKSRIAAAMRKLQRDLFADEGIS